MKAPKRYKDGGEIPKFKSQKEHDDYYTKLGFAKSPYGNALYDTKKYGYDAMSGNWSLPKGSTGNIDFNRPLATDMVEYKEQIIPSQAKMIQPESNRKAVLDGNVNYDTFQYADELGQYGNATNKYFDKKTGAEIDPAQSFDDKGGYIPFQVGKKNGGTITKAPKRFANGGTVYDEDGNPIDPATLAAQQNLAQMQNKQQANNGYLNQATAAVNGAGGQASQGQGEGMKGGMSDDTKLQAITAGAGLASGLAKQFAQGREMELYSSDSEISDKKAKQYGAIGGGATGLQKGMELGSKFGVKGALIGGAAGAIGGGLIGMTRGDKMADSFNYGIRDAKAKKLQDEQQDQYSLDMNEAMRQRQEGYKDGGTIKGKGTGTSDSISAKVKEGSFIVPAKNADKAELIRKTILKAPSIKKKANLNQKGGEEILVSNKEHLFTEKETKKITNLLGEEILEELAPDAYKKGGMVDCYANGGPVKGQKLNYNGKTVTYDGKYWSADDGSIKYSGDMFDSYLKKESEKKSKADSQYEAQKKDALKRHYEAIKNDPSRKDEVKRLEAQLNEAKAMPKTAPKIGTGNKGTSKAKGLASVLNTPKTPELITNTENVDITPSQITATDTVTETPEGKGMSGAKKQSLLNTGLDAAKQIGGLANYYLPYKQTQLGRQFLAASGERPKGKIDPDFQSAVNKAQANAKFGYTPEEQAAINQQNISALRAGENAAKNFSGGSSSNALALSRQAANDYFSRGLKAAVTGKNLQMDKQQYADALNQNKASMNRQLFQDNLNAWNQNQQAGGNLVGMGIQNLLGVNRLEKEKQFQNQYAQNSNPWANFNLNT